MSVVHRRTKPIAYPEVIIWTDETDRSTIATSPGITSGSASPSASAPDGSLYLRTGGDVATTLYVMVDGTWTPVDVDGSSGDYVPTSAYSTAGVVLEGTGAGTYNTVSTASAATPSTIMKRDSSGRARAVASSDASDILVRSELYKGWSSVGLVSTGAMSGSLVSSYLDSNNRVWTHRIGTTTMGTSGPDAVEVNSSGLYHLQWGSGTTSSTTFDMKDTFYGAPKFTTALMPTNLPLNSIDLYSRVTATGLSGVATNTFATGIHILVEATHAPERGTAAYHYIQGQVSFSPSSEVKVRLRQNLSSSLSLIEETSALGAVDMTAGIDLKLSITHLGVVSLAYKLAASSSYTTLTTTTNIADYKPCAVGVHGTNASATITGTALDTYITLPTLTQN